MSLSVNILTLKLDCLITLMLCYMLQAAGCRVSRDNCDTLAWDAAEQSAVPGVARSGISLYC